MKRFVLTLLCCFLLTISAMAAITVTALHTDCAVEKDGTCLIVQTVNLQMGEEPVEELLLPAGADVGKVASGTDGGTAVRRDGCTYLRYRAKHGFSGEQAFTYHYRVKCVPLENGAGQLLAIPLVSADWAWDVQKYDFSVALPAGFAGAYSFESGYYADDVEDGMTVARQGDTVSGSLGGLLDHESLSMKLSMDAPYFPDANTGSRVLYWVGICLVAALSVAALIYFFLTLRSKRDPVVARMLPPDGITPGELPLLLNRGKLRFDLLVQLWAMLGYLSVTISDDGQITLQKRLSMGSERREVEARIFSHLFESGAICRVGGRAYRETAERAELQFTRYWTKRLYVRESGNVLLMRAVSVLVCALSLMLTMGTLLPNAALRALLLIAAFVAGAAGGVMILKACDGFQTHDRGALTLGIVSGIFLYSLARFGGGLPTMLLALALTVFTGCATVHGGKRTMEGVITIAQVQGFRRFLQSATDHHLLLTLHRDPQYYYRMLPYARAAGLGADFSKRFGNVEMESCVFFTAATPLPTSAVQFYQKLRLLWNTER